MKNILFNRLQELKRRVALTSCHHISARSLHCNRQSFLCNATIAIATFFVVSHSGFCMHNMILHNLQFTFCVESHWLYFFVVVFGTMSNGYIEIGYAGNLEL